MKEIPLIFKSREEIVLLIALEKITLKQGNRALRRQGDIEAVMPLLCLGMACVDVILASAIWG